MKPPDAVVVSAPFTYIDNVTPSFTTAMCLQLWPGSTLHGDVTFVVPPLNVKMVCMFPQLAFISTLLSLLPVPRLRVESTVPLTLASHTQSSSVPPVVMSSEGEAGTWT